MGIFVSNVLAFFGQNLSRPNCLTFSRRADVTVHRDAVAIEAQMAKVINSDDDKLIKLCDEDFSALVRYLQKDADSLSEDESSQENDCND